MASQNIKAFNWIDTGRRCIPLIAPPSSPSELPPSDLFHPQFTGYLFHNKHEASTFTKENRHELSTLPGTHGEGTFSGF